MLVTMSDKELRRINVIQSVVEKRMRRRDAVQQLALCVPVLFYSSLPFILYD